MKIFGLQKMTLLDFPGKVACTVFLGGCDFRCPFCHNFELVDGTAKPVMAEEEFFAFLKKRKGLLDGVAVTGGEPCLHKELPEFLARIRELGYQIKLDTNGNHPDMLSKVIGQGLVDYVAMDIKNSPEKYAETIGLDSFDISNVWKSMDMLKSGNTEYEFRTTLTAELHTEDDIRAIGQWAEGAKRYFLQSFTDRETVPFGGFHAPSKEAILRFKSILENTVANVEARGSE